MLESIFTRSTFTLRSLHTPSTLTLRSLYAHSTLTLHSLYTHSTLTLHFTLHSTLVSKIDSKLIHFENSSPKPFWRWRYEERQTIRKKGVKKHQRKKKCWRKNHCRKKNRCKKNCWQQKRGWQQKRAINLLKQEPSPICPLWVDSSKGPNWVNRAHWHTKEINKKNGPWKNCLGWPQTPCRHFGQTFKL